MRRLAIYSCEGFAREVLPLAKQVLHKGGGEDCEIVFVEDNPSFHGKTINDVECISFDTLCSDLHRDRVISVAIANPRARKTVVEKCREKGFEFESIFSPQFLKYDDVAIGKGAIFCANTVVTSNAKIGEHFHCNIYSYVAHDCMIGDFVTFAPRVNCNGRVHIGDFAYIGTGAVLKQGTQVAPLSIGEGAVVGMGSVVTKDVPPNTVVVGNPAKILKQL